MTAQVVAPTIPTQFQRRASDLKNVRLRLQQLYGNDHAFTIESRPGHGTRVTIDRAARRARRRAPGAGMSLRVAIVDDEPLARVTVWRYTSVRSRISRSSRRARMAPMRYGRFASSRRTSCSSTCGCRGCLDST